jgi:hypothetical protein
VMDSYPSRHTTQCPSWQTSGTVPSPHHRHEFGPPMIEGARSHLVINYYIIGSTIPRPPFCATTTYLEYSLSLATDNRLGQTRSLGASAPWDLSFAPSGIFIHIVWEELL